MADVEIVVVGPGEVETLADLYNQIYRPPQEVAFFQRRFLGRYNLAMLLANVDGQPVGFVVGFELKPDVYYAWLCGVLPEYRGLGVAAQLVEGLHGWATEHEYTYIRVECHNRHREILRLAIDQGYDIVGTRWDTERADMLVIFEKQLGE